MSARTTAEPRAAWSGCASVRERDSRIGLASRPRRGARGRPRRSPTRAPARERCRCRRPPTVATFRPASTRSSCSARPLAARPRQRCETARQVDRRARDRWSHDRSRLAAVESLLERRAAARRAERAPPRGPRARRRSPSELWRRRTTRRRERRRPMSVADVTSRISQIQAQLALLRPAPPPAPTRARRVRQRARRRDRGHRRRATHRRRRRHRRRATPSSPRRRSTSACPTCGAAPTRRRAWTAPAWCSGSTSDLGFDLPRVSYQQAKAGRPVASLADAQPGDILAFGSPGATTSASTSATTR